MNTDIISIQSSFKNFQYQLLPSAFKIAECPTYFCWKTIKFSEVLWNRDTVNDCERIKNRTIAILTGTGGYLGGMIALPITVCLTPVTFVADIVVGIAECIFCIYHDLKREDLLIIAHRKFIISPCQHLTFCLGAITGLGASWLIISAYTLNPWLGFNSSLLLWSFGYGCGQKAVGMLSRSLNHQSLNIFIGGGSGEGQNEQEKWLDIDMFNQSRSNSTFKEGTKYNEIEWNDFVNKEFPLLNHINDANLNIEYINFKNRLLNKCKPISLLELPINFSQVDLQEKYRKLALILHPDKNLPRQQEAKALFSILQKAFELLSKQ